MAFFEDVKFFFSRFSKSVEEKAEILKEYGILPEVVERYERAYKRYNDKEYEAEEQEGEVTKASDQVIEKDKKIEKIEKDIEKNEEKLKNKPKSKKSIKAIIKQLKDQLKLQKSIKKAIERRLKRAKGKMKIKRNAAKEAEADLNAEEKNINIAYRISPKAIRLRMDFDKHKDTLARILGQEKVDRIEAVMLEKFREGVISESIAAELRTMFNDIIADYKAEHDILWDDEDIISTIERMLFNPSNPTNTNPAQQPPARPAQQQNGDGQQQSPAEPAQQPAGEPEPQQSADEPAQQNSDGQQQLPAEPAPQADEPDKQADEPAPQAGEPAQQADEPAQQADEPDKQPDEPAQQADEPDKQADEPAPQANEPDKQADKPNKCKNFRNDMQPPVKYSNFGLSRRCMESLNWDVDNVMATIGYISNFRANTKLNIKNMQITLKKYMPMVMRKGFDPVKKSAYAILGAKEFARMLKTPTQFDSWLEEYVNAYKEAVSQQQQGDDQQQQGDDQKDKGPAKED